MFAANIGIPFKTPEEFCTLIAFSWRSFPVLIDSIVIRCLSPRGESSQIRVAVITRPRCNVLLCSVSSAHCFPCSSVNPRDILAKAAKLKVPHGYHGTLPIARTTQELVLCVGSPVKSALLTCAMLFRGCTSQS
jgi:hypothetical protein